MNHEAQTPEALARNCLLIRELNTNIEAVRACWRRPAAARGRRNWEALSLQPWSSCNRVLTGSLCPPACRR